MYICTLACLQWGWREEKKKNQAGRSRLCNDSSSNSNSSACLACPSPGWLAGCLQNCWVQHRQAGRRARSRSAPSPGLARGLERWRREGRGNELPVAATARGGGGGAAQGEPQPPQPSSQPLTPGWGEGKKTRLKGPRAQRLLSQGGRLH